MEERCDAIACGRYNFALTKNPPVLNWGYQLTQVVLHNGRKTVVVIIINATAVSSDGRVVYYGSIRGQPGYAGYAL